MKIAVRRSPRLLAPCLLANPPALCLSMPVIAGDLIGGQAHAINAGDPIGTWRVQDASTLNIHAGAWGGLSLQRASGYHQSTAQVDVSYSW